MTSSCGCKICRKSLGTVVNNLVNDGLSLSDTLKLLENEHSIKVTEKLLQRHLNAFDIQYQIKRPVQKINDSRDNNDIPHELIVVNLNEISLEKYDFNLDEPLSIIRYLQKTHLALYLKQLELVHREQLEFELGLNFNPPNTTIRGAKLLYEIYEASTAINVYANQQAAIRTVEAMGLKVESYTSFIIPDTHVFESDAQTTD
jgi:hypothetical protein